MRFLSRHLLLFTVVLAAPSLVQAQSTTSEKPSSAVEATTSSLNDSPTPKTSRDYPKHDLRSATSASLTAAGKKLKGPAALSLQVLLDRANFSSGEIDGAMGKKTTIALAGFQAARKLPETGTMNSETRAALLADNPQVLTDYTVTTEDVSGPFEPTPEKMEDKAKLTALGYQTPLEGLAEKFHSSPALLKKLNPGKSFDRAGEVLLVPNVVAMSPPDIKPESKADTKGNSKPDAKSPTKPANKPDNGPVTPASTPPATKASRIVVTKADSTVRALAADGTILAQFPASMGSEHDPLPIGTWKIKGVAKNPSFHYNPNLFWDADSKDSKVKVPPGPNNPVGVAWIDLSKEHYGIHGTPEPSKISDTQSHGCIRLTNWDVQRLAQLVSPGMVAELKE